MSLYLGSFVLGAIIAALGYAIILQWALRSKKAQLHTSQKTDHLKSNQNT